MHFWERKKRMKKSSLKIITVLGTRPEIIRLSRVLPYLDRYVNHRIVYTSQSYDYELSTIFFDELCLRKPDYILGVRADTLGKQIGNIMMQTEEVFEKEKPDGVLILGDTNSALSAIIAKRHKIPIFHMEAGNRCFDWNVPEEINRRIVDHISDYNLTYTEHARRYLLREGLDPNTVIVTGSPFAEVFAHYKNEIEESAILNDLKLTKEKYFLASIHREENVDNADNLKELFTSFDALTKAYKLPIIVSLHPRTKKRLEKAKISVSPLVKLLKPFGYFSYCKLQQHAACVLSDSGSIQEESAILGFPAIQVRKSTERPEAFDSGSIVLTGFHKDTILLAVRMQIDERKSIVVPPDYTHQNVSSKVGKFIVGMASLRKNRA